MVHVDTCPHCGERTEIEEPFEHFEGAGAVEYDQECTWCGKPIIAEFRVEYVLSKVRRG